MASWICSTAATASGGAVRPSVIFAISVWRKRPESSSRKPSCISSATLRRSVSWAFMAASSSWATRLSRSRRLAYRKAFSTATEARSASEEARRRSSTVNGSPGWRVRFSTPSTLSPLPSAARGRQRLESMVGSTPSKRGSVTGPCRMKGWLCSATHPAMPSPRPIVDRIASGGSPIEQRISNRAVLGLRSMTEARLAPTASPASRRTRPSCRSRSAPFLSPRPTLARASRSRSERFAAALFDWVTCIGLCSILVTLVGTLEDPEEDPVGEPVWEPIRRFYTRRVMLTAGVDIGGTKVFAVLVDEDGSVCERASHPTDPEAGTASIVLALDQLIGRTGPDAVLRTGSHQGSSSGSSSGPGAIGIAAAAYVAYPSGRIAFDSILRELTGDEPSRITGALVSEAAHAGDEFAAEVLQRAGRWLGTDLATLVNAFDPSVVVIGGSGAAAGWFLLEPARLELDRRLGRRRPVPPIVTATLGNDAGAIGAASLARLRVSGH